MIPKVFHRLHLGRGRVLRTVLEWDKKILQLNPGWEIRYWTRADLPPLRNQALFDLSSNIGHLADIARYELLHAVGGVYLDWDMEPRAALPPLEGVTAFCGQTKPIQYNGIFFDVEIAVLGCEAGHPFFDYLLEQLSPWALMRLREECVLRTGPFFFHTMLQEWESTSRPAEAGLTVFPTHVFYPASPLEKADLAKVHPGASFVHQWWSAWNQPLINGGQQYIPEQKARAALARLMIPSPGTPGEGQGGGSAGVSSSTAITMPKNFPALPCA